MNSTYRRSLANNTLVVPHIDPCTRVKILYNQRIIRQCIHSKYYSLSNEYISSYFPIVSHWCYFSFIGNAQYFPQQDRRLLNHVIHTTEVESLKQCSMACTKELSCSSANFRFIEGVGYTCDLNSHAHKNNMDDFVHEEGAVYISSLEPWKR